nr:hypothetical protein [Tanacetum cinerariifolium]
SDYESWPPTYLDDRFQPSDGYHVVPPPYIGTFMPPKPDLIFNTTPTAVETDHPAFTVSDSEDESKTKAPQIVPSFVQSSEKVKSPRHYVQHAKTTILATTPKLASPKPASSGKRRNRKSCFGNPQHALKDNGVIDSGYSRHMTGNMSYLSDFVELNGRYVAFGGNPKGGK